LQGALLLVSPRPHCALPSGRQHGKTAADRRGKPERTLGLRIGSG
jgi:hypothetical protein